MVRAARLYRDGRGFNSHSDYGEMTIFLYGTRSVKPGNLSGNQMVELVDTIKMRTHPVVKSSKEPFLKDGKLGSGLTGNPKCVRVGSSPTLVTNLRLIGERLHQWHESEYRQV